MMSIYRNAALAVFAFAFASCRLASHPCSSVYAFTTYDEDERPAVTVTDLSFLLEGSSRNSKEEEKYKHAGGLSLLTPGSCCGENHYTKMSVAFIGPIAAQAILTGAGLDDPSSGGVTAPIDTVVTAGQRIHETTSRHSDCVVADTWNWYDNGKSGDMPTMGSKNSSVKNGFLETRVAMVALETNPDAHFDVDETCLPIVRGAMIVFDGRSPHNTVLRSSPPGKDTGVSLIGGFQLSTFSPVGAWNTLDPNPTLTPKSMKKRPKKKKGKSSKKKTKGTKISGGGNTIKSNPVSVDSNNIALGGYCSVSYHHGDPVKGEPAISSIYQGATYLFSSKGAKGMFDANPSKYTPNYGGYCAYGMSMGLLVEANPLSYKLVGDDKKLPMGLLVEANPLVGDDKKLHVFSGNTKPKWEANEEEMKAKADEHWQNKTYKPKND